MTTIPHLILFAGACVAAGLGVIFLAFCIGAAEIIIRNWHRISKQTPEETARIQDDAARKRYWDAQRAGAAGRERG